MGAIASVSGGLERPTDRGRPVLVGMRPDGQADSVVGRLLGLRGRIWEGGLVSDVIDAKA